MDIYHMQNLKAVQPQLPREITFKTLHSICLYSNPKKGGFQNTLFGNFQEISTPGYLKRDIHRPLTTG